MPHRSAATSLLLLLLLSACAPSFSPRPVVIPPDCEPVMQRLAEQGRGAFDERTAEYAAFCQQQHLLRAEEEQAALARLEAEERYGAGWLAPMSFGAGLLLMLVAR